MIHQKVNKKKTPFTINVMHLMPMRNDLIDCLFYRTVDGFTKGRDQIVKSSLDFTPPSEYQLPPQTEPNLRTQETVKTTSFTTSSSKMLVDSPSALPDISYLEVSVSLPLSTNLNGCGIFNNYLFRQDPATGHLSLVPVQVKAPESVLGLDINLSLVPQPLQGLITVPESTDGSFIDCLNAPVRPGPQEHEPPSSHFSGSSVISDSCMEHSVLGAYKVQTNPRTQGENQSARTSSSPNVHPALKEVINLLKGEFSLDGYLDNGHEDIAMGMYLQIVIFISVGRHWIS